MNIAQRETNMSLDNTSHPGGLEHDEFVPSRYALKVGDIDVLVVSDGVISLPAETTATNADPSVRAAWLKDMFLPSAATAFPRAATCAPRWPRNA